MVVQYPNMLNATITTGDSSIDSNGKITPATKKTISYRCRYRPNTSAKTINTADGQTVIYRGTAYIDGQDVELKTGDTIDVVGFIKGVVLQVHKAQFRTRVLL